MLYWHVSRLTSSAYLLGFWRNAECLRRVGTKSYESSLSNNLDRYQISVDLWVNILSQIFGVIFSIYIHTQKRFPVLPWILMFRFQSVSLNYSRPAPSHGVYISIRFIRMLISYCVTANVYGVPAKKLFTLQKQAIDVILQSTFHDYYAAEKKSRMYRPIKGSSTFNSTNTNLILTR